MSTPLFNAVELARRVQANHEHAALVSEATLQQLDDAIRSVRESSPRSVLGGCVARSIRPALHSAASSDSAKMHLIEMASIITTWAAMEVFSGWERAELAE